MPKTIPPLQENKKPFHKRNGSGELNAVESARFFESSNTTLAHMREGGGRLSLDILNTRRNSIPLQAMMMEDQNSFPLMNQNPMMIKNDKKHKQPSSPGGKLAHFLNSLFSQTSSKKSKSKSKSKSSTSTQSMKDEDESPSSWRRNRRSSISLFRSGNSNTTSTTSDTKSSYLRIPPQYHIPQAPTKSTTYKDLRYHADHKPTCEITKMPINENHNNEKPMMKSEFSEKERNSGNGILEKVRVCDVKHDKYDPKVKSREFKSFIIDDIDDDGGDSDSSSDLFELTNCDLGYYSSGLPVFETTHMDVIKRGAPISS